ncbi:MAG: DNA primase [Candidatus Anoxychlamydiales bacterium]|nr:DNA primase [Candidatus Anoxychlamydiales bacterium]
MIDKETKDRAKFTPILEVAESLGLEIGTDKKAYCFNGHDEKTKSLSFDVKTNLYKCFGCNCRGDSIIALVMSVMKCTFKEAVDFILKTGQCQ